jgi:hypothetical protein
LNHAHPESRRRATMVPMKMTGLISFRIPY